MVKGMDIPLKIGDEFTVDEKGCGKLIFKLERINPGVPGTGNPFYMASVRATDQRSMSHATWCWPAVALRVHIEKGQLNILGGEEAEEPLFTPAEGKDMIDFLAKTEAALEFLPEGSPIPYDLGSAGIGFEEKEGDLFL